MARRLAVFASVAALIAAAAPDNGRAALFFLFSSTSATPGETVTVRLGGTPKSFTPAQAMRPFQRPIRVYLVPNAAARVHTRFDTRLHFVGSLVPDARARGILRFTVPPLDADRYAVAAWCPGCAQSSFGRTFFTLPVGSGTAATYRPFMLLTVRPLSFAGGCPATVPNGSTPPGERAAREFHGNGLLWTGRWLNQGIGVRDDDGSYSDKLVWTTIVYARLTLNAVRLDATAPPARWKASEGAS